MDFMKDQKDNLDFMLNLYNIVFSPILKESLSRFGGRFGIDFINSICKSTFFHRSLWKKYPLPEGHPDES